MRFSNIPIIDLAASFVVVSAMPSNVPIEIIPCNKTSMSPVFEVILRILDQSRSALWAASMLHLSRWISGLLGRYRTGRVQMPNVNDRAARARRARGTEDRNVGVYIPTKRNEYQNPL
jgi:hypothetical protein